MSELTGKNIGQYQIEALIGRGGMASVYRARQSSMQRDVALKVIKADPMDGGDFIERFQREAKTIASLSHPYILKVFDYGQQEGIVYIVMELLNGGTLSHRIASGILPLPTVTRIMDEIAEALDYAHHRGIIHRDLKPQNVLLDEAGHAHLSDFGLAKLLGDVTKFTQSGAIMGTPTYMSPEQWSGDPLDARSDLYALGVILFEMLTGKIPFQGDTPFVLMHKHVYDTPPALHEIMPDLPPGVELVVNRALAKNPNDRFASAGELAAAFRDALAEKKTDAELKPPPTASSLSSTQVTTILQPKTQIGRPTLLAIAAGIVLIAIVLLVISRPTISPTSSTNANTNTSVVSTTTNSTGQLISSISLDQAVSTTVPDGLGKITKDNVTALAVVSSWGRGAISAATVSRDGHWLATVDRVGLRLFDLKAPNVAPKQIGTLDDVVRIEFSQDNTKIAALDCAEGCTALNVKMWAIDSGQQFPIVSFSRQDYGDMAFSPDGKTLVTGSDKDAVAFWEVATGKQQLQLTGITAVSRLAFSPDGLRLAVGKTDHSIVLWDVKANTQIAVLQGQTQEITGLTFSPDGSLLATGSDKIDDSSVYLWDAKTGKQLAILPDTDRSNNPYSLTLMFGSDSAMLVSASGDTIRLWDAKKQKLISTLNTPAVNYVALIPGNSQLITHSQFSGIESLDTATGKAVSILPQSGEYYVAFSPDGKRVASAVGKYVYIRDSKTGAVKNILQGAPKVVWAVAYSPDGQTIAASSDGKVYLWNAQTGDPQPVLHGSDSNTIMDLAFNSGGSLLAGADDGGTVRIWDMQTHTSLRILKGTEQAVSSVAFSPDGKILASAGSDKVIRLWDANTGDSIRALSGHDDAITNIRFSPDGALLASASADKTVRLWNVKTGENQNTFQSDLRLTNVTFSPDSTLLAAGGDALKFWNVKTSQELANLNYYTTSLAFSPDGKMIAITNGNATVIGGIQ